MPAARYWKLTGMTAHGGGNIEISELRFYDESDTLIAAPSSLELSTPSLSGTTANLLDGNTSSTLKFDPTPSGAALVADFGVGVTPTVASVLFGSGADRTEFIRSFDLLYSTDGFDWQPHARIGKWIWPGANTLPPFAAGDLFYTSVTALLHCNGSSGSTSIVDNSLAPKSFTAVGGAQVSTAQSKFGGGSLALNGDSAYLTTASSSDFDFGTGDFTIEAHVYRTSGGGSVAGIVTRQENVGGQALYQLRLLSGVPQFVCCANGSFSVVTLAASTVLTMNTWNHIAFSRSGDTGRLFVNGVLVDTKTVSGTFNVAGRPLTVGALNDGTSTTLSSYFSGFFDDIRITKGLARYTSNYTPPSLAFPDSPFGNTEFDTPLGPRPAAETKPLSREDIAGGTSSKVLGSTTRVRDIYNAGRGFIEDTVKIDQTPDDLPVARRVRLHRDADGLLVAETWSRATDGVYRFDEIDETQKYHVISFDHTRNFRAVIADNLTPEVAP